MVKEFRCSENMYKVVSVNYFSPARPKDLEMVDGRVVMKNNVI